MLSKINYTVDENGVITSWHKIPFFSDKPYIEADADDIISGCDIVTDGKFVKGDRVKHAEQVEEFGRKLRIAEEVDKLKYELSLTDYKAIKFAEGMLTEDEFAETRIMRQSIREQINSLETQLG